MNPTFDIHRDSHSFPKHVRTVTEAHSSAYTNKEQRDSGSTMSLVQYYWLKGYPSLGHDIVLTLLRSGQFQERKPKSKPTNLLADLSKLEVTIVHKNNEKEISFYEYSETLEEIQEWNRQFTLLCKHKLISEEKEQIEKHIENAFFTGLTRLTTNELKVRQITEKREAILFIQGIEKRILIVLEMALEEQTKHKKSNSYSNRTRNRPQGRGPQKERPFCTHHQSHTHSTAECRFLKSQESQSNKQPTSQDKTAPVKHQDRNTNLTPTQDDVITVQLTHTNPIKETTYIK
ncbi:hypothetical protein NEHOM01_0249 [Nematocida homosporus]|uniref:uncharacterized protein n=1 Tax=Nematocida homosporus TaxID=1912981 RepID=UPI002220CEB7|nr:uncharacterized protein NEHOM01_0249 [Nematocida homosporus]KAI5184574.1 hypothetical protein NEHOM01_0249 [Nematocida homosporus]